MKTIFRFSSSSGFAFIELVALIAVVLMLIMVQLAALNRADARTKTIQDLSNSKMIMVAMQLYSAENSDFLPRPGWGNNADCWAAGSYPSPNTGMSFIAPGNSSNYVNSTLPTQLNYVRHGQLWPYMKTSQVFMCPADGPGRSLSFYDRPVVITSYVWNGAISGYPAGPDSAGTPVFKVTNPRFKSDAVLQWETYDGSFVGVSSFNDLSSYPSEGISPRHGNRAPIAMFGGGAEMIPYARWYQPNSPGNLNAYDSFACSGGAPGTPGYTGSGNNTAPNRAWCNPKTATGH